MDLDVYLTRVGQEPWGFRLIGGIDFNMPLTVVKITPHSPADVAGLQNGDTVVIINGELAEHMTHDDSKHAVAAASDALSLEVVRGLYDPVIEETELLDDLDQDFDQQSRPSEVFTPLEFTDQPTMVIVPDLDKNDDLGPYRLDNDDLGLCGLDKDDLGHRLDIDDLGNRLDEVRSLTSSPYMHTTKPYRPFSTEPLEVPPLEEPIILNPDYKDVWPDKEDINIGNNDDLISKLISEEFLPKTRFKLPISEQYDPDGTKGKTVKTSDVTVVDINKTSVEVIEKTSKEVVEKSSAVCKEVKIVESNAEIKSKVLIEENNVEKKERDVLDKIEFAASTVVDESIEKAIAVSEVIKKEIDVEIHDSEAVESAVQIEQKERQNKVEVISEMNEFSDFAEVVQEKVESKSAVKEHEQLVELLNGESEEISKENGTKTKVSVAREVDKIESAEIQVDSIKAVEERRQSTKHDIEEVVEAGSVKKNLEVFEKEEKKAVATKEVVQKQKESRIEEETDIKRDVREIVDKSEICDKRQVSEKVEKSDKSESATVDRKVHSERKYSTSKLLAEQRAYTIGLQTIPNIRGSIHSSYHYNLLLKTFFIHLTDVMVALARFILTESVLDKDDTVTARETVTETKTVNEKKDYEEMVTKTGRDQRKVSKTEQKAETVVKQAEKDDIIEKKQDSVVDNTTAKHEIKAVAKEQKPVTATQEKAANKTEVVKSEVKVAKKEKDVVEVKRELKVEEKKEIVAAKNEIAVIKAVQAKAMEERAIEKETMQETHKESSHHKVSGSQMAQRVEKKSGELMQTMGAVIHEFQNKAGIEETVEVTETIETQQEFVGTHKSKPKKDKTIYVATVESHVYTNKDAVLVEQLSGGSSMVQSPEEGVMIKEVINKVQTENFAVENKIKQDVATAVIEAAEEKITSATNIEKIEQAQNKVSETKKAATAIVATEVKQELFTENFDKQSIAEIMEKKESVGKILNQVVESQIKEAVAVDLCKEEKKQGIVKDTVKIEKLAVVEQKKVQEKQEVKSLVEQKVEEKQDLCLKEKREVIEEKAIVEQQTVQEKKDKMAVCLIRPTTLAIKQREKKHVQEKQEVVQEELKIEEKTVVEQQKVEEKKDKKAVCLIRPTTLAIKQCEEKHVENKQGIVKEAVKIEEKSIVKQKTLENINVDLHVKVEEKQEIINDSVKVAEISVVKETVQEKRDKKSVCLIRPATLAAKHREDPNIVKKKDEVSVTKIEEISNTDIKSDATKIVEKQTLIQETFIEDPHIVKKKDIVEEQQINITLKDIKQEKQEFVAIKEQQAIKESVAKKTDIKSILKTDKHAESRTISEFKSETNESQSTFVAKLSNVESKSIDQSKIDTAVKQTHITKELNSEAKQITVNTTIANQAAKLELARSPTDENNNEDTPLVPPTPLTDEYIFKLQIELPKGITPVPPDPRSPEDLIVKKNLVPHIDTTISSPILYDPPLPTPPGTPGSKVTSPVYTKPGLRGGADKELVKEEILEIERKSSLLASAIDQTIKSIEEYKEEVGIKKEKERRDSMETRESESDVTSEKDWSKIKTKVTTTNTKIDELSDSIKRFAESSMNTEVNTNGDAEETTEYNEVDIATTGIVTEESVEINSREVDVKKTNTVEIEEVTEISIDDTKNVNGTDETDIDIKVDIMNGDDIVDIKVEQVNGSDIVNENAQNMNRDDVDRKVENMNGSIVDRKEENGNDQVEKRSPMEGYRPVKFDPAEIQNALQNLKSAYANGSIRAPPVTPSREIYKNESGELLGTIQGIVDGLEEAVVDPEIAKELGKPGMTDDKIAELISGEAEMLREAHVMGLSRVLKSHMTRDPDCSVDFKKIKPIINSLKDSEVLKALNDEVIEEMMRERERKKKELEKDEKKWTTFLQKPTRPVPRAKFGYHGYREPEVKVPDPYKVKIVKQPKPKVAPDYKPENFNTGLLPWEERALREPTPPPVDPEDPILIPEEAAELLEAVDPLPESAVPDLEDSGIPLPEQIEPEELEVTSDVEEAEIEIEEQNLEVIEEEENKEEKTEEKVEMDQSNIAEQLISSVKSMVDPTAPMEQQLAQMRAQVAALSQLPCVIQQSLEMVTRQLTQLSQMESTQTTTQKVEVTETTEVTEVIQNEEKTSETIEEHAETIHNSIAEEQVNGIVDESVEETKPKVTAEELERMRKEEEEMLEEQRRVEKQKKIDNLNRVWPWGDAKSLCRQYRINFMKYEKPPVSLDHLKDSETYKLIHNLEEAPLKRVEMLTPVVAEADYREKCRSMTPCDIQMQP